MYKHKRKGTPTTSYMYMKYLLLNHATATNYNSYVRQASAFYSTKCACAVICVEKAPTRTVCWA